MIRAVRDWLKNRWKGGQIVNALEAAPRPLSEVLRDFAGRWVAVDRTTNEPLAAADTPYALAAELRSRQIKNVAIVRAPDPSEPELVGLG